MVAHLVPEDEALVDWTSDVRSDEILESQVWVGAGRRITNVGINWEPRCILVILPSKATWPLLKGETKYLI